jgi:hypothetical protein
MPGPVVENSSDLAAIEVMPPATAAAEPAALAGTDTGPPPVAPPPSPAGPPALPPIPTPPPLPPLAPGYSPTWQSPPGPPRQNRTGLLIGIVAAVIVVLAGAGVGAYLLLRGDDTGGTTNILAGSSTTAVADTATTSGQTTITRASTTTTQTVTTIISTTTTSAEPSTEDYLTATDDLVQMLVDDDARIPQLATQINDTAPKVPRAVWNELQSMMGQLDAGFTRLDEVGAPADFEESNGWLVKAANAMGNRIDATIKGIEAMWQADQVSAGTKYFDLGRQARDEYRAAFQKFQDVVPID